MTCDICQRFAKANKFYSPNYAVETHDIFRHWGIDTVGPFPEDAQDNKYGILAVDFLTRWPEVMPAKTATATDAANFIYNHLICRYGLPESIQSDNGPQYANVSTTQYPDQEKPKYQSLVLDFRRLSIMGLWLPPLQYCDPRFPHRTSKFVLNRLLRKWIGIFSISVPTPFIKERGAAQTIPENRCRALYFVGATSCPETA